MKLNAQLSHHVHSKYTKYFSYFMVLNDVLIVALFPTAFYFIYCENCILSPLNMHLKIDWKIWSVYTRKLFNWQKVTHVFPNFIITEWHLLIGNKFLLYFNITLRSCCICYYLFSHKWHHSMDRKLMEFTQ